MPAAVRTGRHRFAGSCWALVLFSPPRLAVRGSGLFRPLGFISYVSSLRTAPELSSAHMMRLSITSSSPWSSACPLTVLELVLWSVSPACEMCGMRVSDGPTISSTGPAQSALTVASSRCPEEESAQAVLYLPLPSADAFARRSRRISSKMCFAARRWVFLNSSRRLLWSQYGSSHHPRSTSCGPSCATCRLCLDLSSDSCVHSPLIVVLPVQIIASAVSLCCLSALAFSPR
jgi:hypothetical protein